MVHISVATVIKNQLKKKHVCCSPYSSAMVFTPWNTKPLLIIDCELQPINDTEYWYRFYTHTMAKNVGHFEWRYHVHLSDMESLVTRGNSISNILLCNQHCINLLWLSDPIWRLESGSTLVQVMACCLTAPSHYLNQCWHISKVQRHSSECNFRRDALTINH